MKDRFGGLCECGDHAWAVLTFGFVTLVTPGDASLLIGVKWCRRIAKFKTAHPEAPYAGRVIGPKGKRKGQLLHREIALPNDDEVVDHINGNTLDNRRENLRVCTKAQNAGNRKLPRCINTTSRFKGVRKPKKERFWCAHLRGRYLGSFPSEEEAAAAYDRAALAHYGEFALTNKAMGLL